MTRFALISSTDFAVTCNENSMAHFFERSCNAVSYEPLQTAVVKLTGFRKLTTYQDNEDQENNEYSNNDADDGHNVRRFSQISCLLDSLRFFGQFATSQHCSALQSQRTSTCRNNPCSLFSYSAACLLLHAMAE